MLQWGEIPSSNYNLRWGARDPNSSFIHHIGVSTHGDGCFSRAKRCELAVRCKPRRVSFRGQYHLVAISSTVRENRAKALRRLIAVKTPQILPRRRKYCRECGILYHRRADRGVEFSRHGMMRRNAEAPSGFRALCVVHFGFHNQSRLPRRLVPNTFAGV
jgi:hypothetical protein